MGFTLIGGVTLIENDSSENLSLFKIIASGVLSFNFEVMWTSSLLLRITASSIYT